MPEYIERDEILHRLIEIGGCDATDEWDKGYDGAIDAAISIVDCAPAADVQPVKHGRWIDTEPEYNYERHCSAHYQCSECGRRTGIKQTRTYKYCPTCGARMDDDNNAKEN